MALLRDPPQGTPQISSLEVFAGRLRAVRVGVVAEKALAISTAA